MSKKVDLRPGKGKGLVLHSAGKERTFHYHTFNVFFEAEGLTVSLRPNREAMHRLAVSITGQFSFSNCTGLSVIGEPADKVKSIRVSIYAGNPAALGELLKDPENPSALGFAEMGFIKGDVELGSYDMFFMDVLLPEETVRALADEVTAGRVKNLHLGGRFQNLYTDLEPFMPLAEKRPLFLRPDARENRVDWPEGANGFLESLQAVGPEVVLTQQEQEQHTWSVQEEAAAPSPAQPDSQLAGAVESLRKTVKWVGGLIAFGLLLLVLK